MVIPPSLLPIYKKDINKYNPTSSTIEQIALSLFMKEGNLEKHIRRLRKLYTRKNQTLVESIHLIMRDNVSIRGKEGGLHLLLEVKTDFTADQLVNLADKLGVKVTPVSNYYIDSSSARYPQILLSFAGIPKDDIIPAIILLQDAWFMENNL
jgi:GntR family transcriptional regulator/MocR family aminotransferase